MTKHARNNCALPVFTYEERRKLAKDGMWGTQKQRLGTDSMPDYNTCLVCLHSTVEPMAWYVFADSL